MTERIYVALARSRLGLNYNLNRKTETVGAMFCAFTMPENGNTGTAHNREPARVESEPVTRAGTVNGDTTPRDSIGQRLTSWNSGRLKHRTTGNPIAKRCERCQQPRERGTMPEPANCLDYPRKIYFRPKWRVESDCQDDNGEKVAQKSFRLFGASFPNHPMRRKCF